MSKQVKTVGMLLALSALPMGAAYAGNVTSQAVVQNAQADAECKGVVFDATGEPMIGASVVVKGKSGLGTVTDIDGNFTLRNVKKGDVIRITSLGMTPVEMEWSGKPLKVTLNDDSKQINEVVVTLRYRYRNPGERDTFAAVRQDIYLCFCYEHEQQVDDSGC